MRRTTAISVGLISFLSGMALARVVGFSWLWLMSGAMMVPIAKRRKSLNLLSIIFLGLGIGLWRGTVYLNLLAPYKTLAYRPVTILATARSDAVYGLRSQLEFEVTDIQLTEPYRQHLVGTIGVSGYGPAMIYRGDQVQVTAKLYLARGSRQAKLSFAKVRLLSRSQSPLQSWRRRFAAGLQSVLPEPLGSLGLGLLIGQRTTLPSDTNQQLAAVGLTHIVAVSGYNLTIIIMLVRRLANRLSKFQSTILTLVLIGGFLLITGNSASIVRAAVVSSLSLWAWYYGRAIRPSLLVLLAASLTAGWFPPYLWSDVGWHLSFIAFAGILVVAPKLQAWRKKPGPVRELVVETSVAQLMTLPLILFIFGRLSFLAIVANMLIIPIVPLAMMLSFIAGVSGMVWSAAGWLSWPAKLCLTYMLDVVRLIASLPLESINVVINTWQLIVLYGAITAVVFTLHHKKAKITDEKTERTNSVRSFQVEHD